MTGKPARPDGARSAPIAPPALPKGGRAQVRVPAGADGRRARQRAEVLGPS